MNRQFSMMAVGLWMVALWAGSILEGAAQEMGPTVSQPGLFSYQAPKGWMTKDTPVSKYPVAFDMPVNDFAANINVVVESTSKSLAEYIAANEAFLKSSPMFVNLQVVDKKPFVTTSGAKGTRILVNDTLGKMNLAQTFYFFEGSANNKFVVTATCKVGDGEHYAPFFDQSMKTFSPQ